MAVPDATYHSLSERSSYELSEKRVRTGNPNHNPNHGVITMTLQFNTFADLAAALKAQGMVIQPIGEPKARSTKRRTTKTAKRSKADVLADKDASILSTFKRRGITNVVLMDRSDRSKAFNVRPFGRVMEDGSKTGWLGEGRVVKKGETSVRGLFHVSQTEELPSATV